MSSRSLLVSGSAGPPTTLADEGRRHLIIDSSEQRSVHPAVLAAVQSSVGRIMGQLGADPVDALAWSGLPQVVHLNTLHAMLDGLADSRFDRVVVDCESLHEARQLLQTPSTLLRLLDSALTPRLAMWRFPSEPESDRTIFEALSDVRDDLLRIESALTDADTVMRVLASSDDEVSACLDAASLFGVLGVASEVWLGADRVLRVRPLAVSSDTVHEVGDDYSLDLALSGSAAASARVGRSGEDLVVEFDGVLRWLPLPPVLLRCTAVEAARTAEGLRVRFTPDPLQWRQSAGSAA
ncbi:MAG: hypothetical protein PSX37_03415 [bacterium]|nr:hypothetical protein [bacterium]